MTKRVFNFGAGPAMLPIPVMEEIQRDFLNYNNMGVSVIEISHRSKEFIALLEETDALFKELTQLPDNYKILYVPGGARMQFSAIPMNLMNRVPSKKALYVQTGNFAKLAENDAKKYGDVVQLASGADTNYDRIPDIIPSDIDQSAAYMHITSNNTIYGTRWNQFPDTGAVPLVADMTSEILSREMDYSKFGIVYAGLQKNLGPSGMAMVVIREDLLGSATPETPVLLNYETHANDHSLTNTINTFAIYVVNLVLKWLKSEGGVAAIEERNDAKAQILYEYIDNSTMFSSVAHAEHRSMMNVPFTLPTEELTQQFLKEAGSQGLYALKGHRAVGGCRASIYNPMPIEGVQALVDFMKAFESKS